MIVDDDIPQACDRNWVGTGEHLWSVPDLYGEQECFFCERRRKLVIVEEMSILGNAPAGEVTL